MQIKQYVQFAKFMRQLSRMRADKIFFNAHIITMNPNMPFADSLAVKDGRIIAVGKYEETKLFGSAKTERIDMRRKTLIPGFIEPHNHFAMYGDMLLGVDCRPESNSSIEEILEKIRERAKKTPPNRWIQGWGYDDTLISDKRHLTRYDLDRVAPNHFVYISHISGHIGYANSKLLKRINISKDTPDPNGGEIFRDKNGEPTGVLAETPVLMPIYNLIPKPTINKIVRGMRKANREFLAAGVTSINDGGFFGIAPLVAYRTAHKRGAVNIRVYANIFAQVFELLEKEGGINLEKLGINSGSGNDKLRIGAVKIIQDGSIQGFTAALMEPYLSKPNEIGKLTLDQSELDRLVEKYHKAGFQIQIHGNGDRAIESIIRAFEKAQDKFPRDDHRHQIIHCQMVNENQLERMAKIGIIANFFPVHVYYWGDRHREIFLGEERASRIDPLKSALEHGVIFSMHSDVPVTPVSPIMSIYAAVNRLTRKGEVLGVEQRISVYDALKAVTINAAFMTFSENEKGSIERGKLADFVVLSEDPFSIDPEKIKSIKIEKTIIGGEIVYSNREGINKS